MTRERLSQNASREGMPLLDYASRLFDDVDLSDCLVIACQHLLRPIFVMFEEFVAKGLKPENTFVMGKCYSTNIDTLEKFKKIGIYVDPSSAKFDSHRSFDEQFGISIENFLNNIINKADFDRYSRIVILDDGGTLLHAANNMVNNFEKVSGVEQTSSGYARLKHVKLKYPVINVARSTAKLELESPFIAELAADLLNKHLKKLNARPKNILVVGVGPIGKNMYDLLREKFNADCYDLNPQISNFKTKSLPRLLNNYDLVVGCTGTTAIKPQDYNLLKKRIILASVSSSDNEFSASSLRKLVPRSNNCHRDMVIKNITLINSGFPISFSGAEYANRPKDIQITIALLFSAVCLASRSSSGNGFVALDKIIQSKLVKKFDLLGNS